VRGVSVDLLPHTQYLAPLTILFSQLVLTGRVGRMSLQDLPVGHLTPRTSLPRTPYLALLAVGLESSQATARQASGVIPTARALARNPEP
jgi:hypothetical protein